MSGWLPPFLFLPWVPVQVARGALEEASEDVQKLFKVLEREFDPLNLADKGQAALEELAKHAVYARYSDPLINNLILRLLLEVLWPVVLFVEKGSSRYCGELGLGVFVALCDDT